MSDSVIGAIEGASPSADDLTLAKLPANDLGLGQRLRARFGDRIAKTPEAGWAAWTGKVWALGAKGEAQARIFAHRTASALWDEYNAAKTAHEALGEGDVEAAKKLGFTMRSLLDVVDKAGDSNKTNAMLAQAAPYLWAELKDFDPSLSRITVENGTLEISFIGEPCIVAFDADGRVAARRRVSEMKPDAPGAAIGPWRVRNLGEGMWEVHKPDLPEDEAGEAIEKAELQAGLSHPTAGRLVHKLFHQDVALRPHDPAHRITRIAGCAFDPAATAPLWREHIEKVLPDPEVRKFFQRAMGYGLTGEISSQCFLFIQGKGADGKSTTMKVITRVLGGYARTCDPRTWLESKNRSAADASPDVADLAGDTRLVYCEEPPKGVRVNEALLKQVTGGVEMRARQLHRDLFDFAVRFVLVMAFNDLPRVSGGDDGFWRRVRLVRFTRQFTEAEQLAAGDMVAKLSAEAPGILNWLLEGLASWRRFGLPPTARMAEDILEWRSTSDPFGEWFRECVVKGAPTDKVKNSDLYKSYKEHLEAEGVDGREVLGVKGFANRLSSLQIPMRKTNGGDRYRMGVKLKPVDPLGWSEKPADDADFPANPDEESEER